MDIYAHFQLLPAYAGYTVRGVRTVSYCRATRALLMVIAYLYGPRGGSLIKRRTRKNAGVNRA